MKSNKAKTTAASSAPGTTSQDTGLGPSETQKGVLGGKPFWVLVVAGLYGLTLLGALGMGMLFLEIRTPAPPVQAFWTGGGIPAGPA